MKVTLAFCVSFAFFLALFVLVELNVAQYLLLLDAILFPLLVSYGRRENCAFFQRVFSTAIGCSGAFAASKALAGYWLCKPTMPEAALLAVGVAEYIAILFFSVGRKVPSKELPPIHPERRYDLERIRTYIQDFEAVGINAEWGTGKSFVLECLKQDKKMQEEYEIIQIDLLSCNLDAVELVVVEELEKLFQKNRLHPGGVRHLKRLLGKNEWTDLLGGLLAEDSEGLASAYESFSRELGMLKKKVLLIFEDVDRIPAEDTMRKIFAIAEKLSGERLRVIFQYDVQELKDKSIDRHYLEKYIPYTVNLTSIPYPRLVEYLWDELDMKDCPLPMEWVRDVASRLPSVYEVNRILGAEARVEIDLSQLATTRKVRIFLRELKHMLAENKELGTAENAETTMRVLFVKHFFNEIYESLCIGISPLDSLLLKEDGGELTLPLFLEKYKKPQMEEPEQVERRLAKVSSIISRQPNRDRWFVLLLLNFELGTRREMSGIDESVSEPIADLKRQEKNQKIDRLVWNIKANGTSEITDMENAFRKLCEEVLPLTGEARTDAWEHYQSDMYYGRLNKDNSTVFWLFWDPFLSLFRAMAVLGASEAQWESFLDFYFSQYQIGAEVKTISTHLIDNCNYCDIGRKKILFRVIRFFNGLAVAGNLNRDESYCSFVRNYMGSIVVLGYVRYMESSMFKLLDKSGNFVTCARTLFEELRKELEERRAGQTLLYIREEYDVLIEFINKNIALVQCEKCLPQRGPSIKANASTRYAHEEEMKRLRTIRDEAPEVYELELERSYKDGKLYPMEVEALQREQL